MSSSSRVTHDAPTDLTVAAALVRKAYSKRRRSRLWSKPVNLRTWGLVSDSIVMVQALEELRYGVVAYTRAKQREIWAQLRPHPLSKDAVSWFIFGINFSGANKYIFLTIVVELKINQRHPTYGL